MPSTRDRLIPCFSTVFPKLGAAEIPHTSTATNSAWDSVALATLIAVIEEEFGVEMDPEDYEKLTSFEAIERAVTSKAAHG